MFRVQSLNIAAVVLLGAWVAAPGPSSALECNFYVRQGFVASPGDGKGETPESAFGSIGEAAASDSINNGDVVCVGPGTYEEGDITPKSGYAGFPIEFVADPTGESTGDPSGMVLIVPPPFGPCGAPSVPSVAFNLLGLHDLVIDGFTIAGFCDAAIQVRSRAGFDAVGDNNAHDVTIRNNVVSGNGKLGIDVTAEGLIVIEGNQLLNNGESGLSLQSCVDAPLPAPTPTSDGRCRAGPSGPVIPVVSNNRIASNGAHGIFVGDAESGLVQNNIVSDNHLTGITLRAAADFAVVNNLVVRNGEEGLAAGSADRASPNVRVVNNTFYANGEWGIEIGSGGATSPGAIVLNNIVRGNGGGTLGIGVLSESVPALSELLRSTCGYVSGFNLTADTYGPKTPHNIYDVQDDPLFVDAAGNDFHLAGGSPAIDAGSASVNEIGLTGSVAADGRPDTGRIDVGFHYDADPSQMIQVPEPFMPVYVRSAGDDLDDGKSPSAALATITAGARRARAGVTVVVGPGRYPECAIAPPPDQGKATFLADPTGRRTKEQAGPVLVDAGACAVPTGQPGFLLGNACFAVVDGFHVRGAFDDGVQVQAGSHFAEVRNNVTFSNGRRGINVINAGDVRIVNNLVYANAGGGIQIGGACSFTATPTPSAETQTPSTTPTPTGSISETPIGTPTPTVLEGCDLAGSRRAVIQGNTSYYNAFNGVLIGAGLGVSSHTSVRYNVIVDNGENGIQIGNANNPVRNLEGFVAASGFNVLSGHVRDYAGTPELPADLREDPMLVLPAGADRVLGGDNFRDDTFCLSQIAAGQPDEASGVIDYSDVTAEQAGMADRSTRTDLVPDSGNLDPGYHYPLLAFTDRGDCDGDGKVSIAELILAVRIALASSPMTACPNLDVDLDGRLTIEEVVGAVGDALSTTN